MLDATKPAGVFCTGPDDRTVVAYCGGSGVTPVMSITRDVLAGSDRSVRILYANRDRASVIFHDELERLARRAPRPLARAAPPRRRVRAWSTRRRSSAFVEGALDAAPLHLRARARSWTWSRPRSSTPACRPSASRSSGSSTRVSTRRRRPAAEPTGDECERRARRGHGDPQGQAHHHRLPSRATRSSRRHAAAASSRRSRARPATAPRAWPCCTTAPPPCAPTTPSPPRSWRRAGCSPARRSPTGDKVTVEYESF